MEVAVVENVLVGVVLHLLHSAGQASLMGTPTNVPLQNLLPTILLQSSGSRTWPLQYLPADVVAVVVTVTASLVLAVDVAVLVPVAATLELAVDVAVVAVADAVDVAVLARVVKCVLVALLVPVVVMEETQLPHMLGQS